MAARETRSESVERRIKDAVIVSVAEDGFDGGLDPKAICARAQVPESEFHARWPDGWAALDAVIEERARLPGRPDTGVLADDLVFYALTYEQFFDDPQFVKVVFCLFAVAKSDPAVRARLGPSFAARRARALVIIDRAKARGELGPEVNGHDILDEMLNLGMAWSASGGFPAEPEVRRAVERTIASAQSAAKEAREPPPEPDLTPEDAYLLHLFDNAPAERGGRAVKVEVVPAPSEQEAIAQADTRRRGRYAELWKQQRLIRIFDAA